MELTLPPSSLAWFKFEAKVFRAAFGEIHPRLSLNMYLGLSGFSVTEGVSFVAKQRELNESVMGQKI
jgi:hypothetical protein